jgi:hypothetical protein
MTNDQTNARRGEFFIMADICFGHWELGIWSLGFDSGIRVSEFGFLDGDSSFV